MKIQNYGIQLDLFVADDNTCNDDDNDTADDKLWQKKPSIQCPGTLTIPNFQNILIACL